MPSRSKKTKPQAAANKAEQHQLDRLLAFLRQQGRFSLGLATYDDRHRRDEVIRRAVEQSGEQGVAVTQLVLPRHERDLLGRLTEHLRFVPTPSVQPRAVMVTGIEESLYGEKSEPGQAPPLFGNANMMREAFSQQCPLPLVLWLMPAATALLAQTAPDFWHWRAATFDFTSPEKQRRDREDKLIAMRDPERLALPRRQREENVTMLCDLLKQVEQSDDADSFRGLGRRWELLNQLGQAYRDQSQLAEARQYHEQALQLATSLAERDNRPNNLPLAVSYNNLGGVLQDLNDLPGARENFKRALRIGEGDYGSEHPQVAIYANNLGLVLQDLGDLAGAREHFEWALRIGEQVYGPLHPQFATYANNLGGVFQDLGDLAAAREHFERALRIGEQVYGSGHPQFATYANNLGGVLQDLGDLTGASSLYSRALEIDEVVYGPGHPSVARDVNNLGRVLQDFGDLAGAREHFERALTICRKSYGDEHPRTRLVRQNLQQLNRKGNFDL